jgi:hypothetical protein
MAALRPLEAIEIEYDNEAGFFFRRLGEIAISTPSAVQDNCPALCASRLAVTSQSGVIIYCDSTGKLFSQREKG